MRMDDFSRGSLLLSEYVQIKNEQAQRIATRDNLIYATLVALAGAVAVVLQSRDPALLLVVPPVCVVLGWTYYRNDSKITEIRAYVLGVLGPECTRLLGASVVAFGWERQHRARPDNRGSTAVQLAVDLMLFCGSGSASLLVYWSRPTPPSPFLVVSIGEGLGVLVLAYYLIHGAILGRGSCAEAKTTDHESLGGDNTDEKRGLPCNRSTY